MHTRRSRSSNDTIISNLNSTVESLISELEQIKSSSVNLHEADALKRLEVDLHAKTIKIADLISAIKLQETLDSDQLEIVLKNMAFTGGLNVNECYL